MDSNGVWLASPDEIQRVTGCSERTARRWYNEPQRIPEPARRLLQLHSDRTLLNDDFAGFRCHSGKLWTPTGTGWTPGELLAVQIRLQQLSAMRVLMHQNQETTVQKARKRLKNWVRNSGR